MLVAKYVKVFLRTGTLPSLLGCCFRLDFGPSTQGDGSNFWPTGIPTHVSRRILPIINILGALAYSHGNHALLDNDPGIGKSLDILSSRRQAFPSSNRRRAKKRQENIALQMGLPKEVSGRLAPARVT